MNCQRRLCLRSTLFAALLLVAALGAGRAHAQGTGHVTCYGKFPNPISDICWNCIFPISIGAFAVDMGQEDIENPALPVCFCPIPVPPYMRMGLSIGFWEPTRLIESTRTPFCFPALNGYYMDSSSYKPSGATSYTTRDRKSRDSFYQVHVYVNPILYYIEDAVNQMCLESGSYDLAYMSEYDPMWHDDQESAILAPESAVVTNLLAIAACSADCVAASVGFGLKELFWCSGCNGPVYPMNGNVPVHIGGVQASSLLNHRILAKLHRLMIAWQWHGASALCQGHPAPLMDKRGYKTQMVYPIPMTSGTDGTSWGRCCQPLGRSTQVWGMGREFPIKGEDFAYQVFRKRNCCMD